jgi:hypothetical protein
MSSASEIVLSAFKLDDSNFSASSLTNYFSFNLNVFEKWHANSNIVPVRHNHYTVENNIVPGLATKRF